VTGDQEKVAAVLADARAEALEERPLSCAAVNSVTRRLAGMYGAGDATFDRDAFYAAANCQGMSGDYRKCAKPDCMRKIAGGFYCCGPCADAAGGGYEIHAHSATCDGRAAERGEYAPPEARA